MHVVPTAKEEEWQWVQEMFELFKYCIYTYRKILTAMSASGVQQRLKLKQTPIGNVFYNFFTTNKSKYNNNWLIFLYDVTCWGLPGFGSNSFFW